jgi:hypothetical protein
MDRQPGDDIRIGRSKAPRGGLPEADLVSQVTDISKFDIV